MKTRPRPFHLPTPSLRPWSRTERRRVGQFRVFDVDQTSYVDGAGHDRGHFFTFECPDWCNVVAITEDNELVLVWQYRFGTDRLSLELPGGVCEAGEPPLTSARRELAEETGFSADTWAPLGPVEVNPALQNNVCHSFLATGARRVGLPSPDANEELEVVLVGVEHAARLVDEGHVRHSLCVIAIEQYLRSLRS